MIREFLPERATAIAAMFLVLVSKVGFEYSHLMHLNNKSNSTGIPGHDGFRSEVDMMIAAETVGTIRKQTV